MLGYTWRTRGVIFLTNILVISIFGGIGYVLDQAFDKKAFFIFLLLILSFPLPTVIIRRIIKKERANSKKTVSPETDKLDTLSVKEYLK